MRIAVTSDIHFHPPWRERITRLASMLRAMQPDLMILAGDVGEPLNLFEQGLEAFAGVSENRAVIAGNHDLWNRTSQTPSQELWESLLPQAAFKLGYHWLEYNNLTMGSVGVCGTIGWYDYSGRHPEIDLDEDSYEELKASISNDGRFIDWKWTDREFAARVGAEFEKRLDTLQQSPEIETVVAVTHVPLFRRALRTYDLPQEAIANAYYANLPLGKTVMKYDKVRAIFSGHVHIERQYTVERADGNPIFAFNVPSDYGAPAALIWDVDSGEATAVRAFATGTLRAPE